jgi:hypothetical protein
VLLAATEITTSEAPTVIFYRESNRLRRGRDAAPRGQALSCGSRRNSMRCRIFCKAPPADMASMHARLTIALIAYGSGAAASLSCLRALSGRRQQATSQCICGSASSGGFRSRWTGRVEALKACPVHAAKLTQRCICFEPHGVRVEFETVDFPAGKPPACSHPGRGRRAQARMISERAKGGVANGKNAGCETRRLSCQR